MGPIDFEALFSASPNPYVLLDPSLAIVTMNPAYLRVTGRSGAELVGCGLFEAFPSDPASVEHRQLRHSFERVLRDRVADHLPLIRYAIPLPNGRGYEERYWSATHTPLFAVDGSLAFILQHTVDVTELHRLRRIAESAGREPTGSALIETDVLRRAEEVQQVNQALETERLKLAALFEQVPGFMAVLRGTDHVFELANAAYRRLIGEREVLGLKVRDALPEVVGQGFVALLDRVYASGQPFVGKHVRVELVAEPGMPAATRYLDFIYQPIRGEDGATSGILVQGHDVTEQKAAEDALRESEERFRLVAESAPVMLWMGDTTGKCVYLNRTLRDFWGVREDEVSSFDWSTTLHPEDLQLLHAPYAHAMETRTGFSVEARYRRADGTHRLVHTDSRPRFGADGSFLGMIGVNVDVTDLRAAEEGLRTETHHLEILNRTGVEIAAELNIEAVVQKVVDACVELTGASFGAFFYNVVNANGESYRLYTLSGAPRAAFEAFPMPRATALFQPTFKGEGTVRSDDIAQDPRYGAAAPYFGMPPGHLPVRSYMAVPVTSRAGEVLGGLLFGHPETARFKDEHEDLVTGIAGQAATAIDNARLFQAVERELAERKRAEAALQALNQTLEQRVVEEVKHRSRAEDALRQAQKMEAVGQLTGGIAHDFNNLLQGIIGSLNIMQQRIRQGRISDLERWTVGAMTSAQRAASLTHRLLAFARRQPLDPKPVNVNPLVASMEDLVRRTIGEHIQLELVLAAGVWTTLCDPNQLESAVLNLAINARDAMPDGGRLTIETCNTHVDSILAKERGMSAGQYVCICVTDTGVGMTPEVLERAFDPFFTTKPIGQGTGLGLSMIYGFARQSEGFSKIYSEVGKGTTVKLYLPRHWSAAESEASAVPEPNPDHDGAGQTIMVVEDETVVRGLILEVLRDLGYRTIEAADGPAALELLRAGHTIDLLVTDIGLPGVNGRQVADAARIGRPDLKVLFMTGYAENAAIANGFLEPGMAMITKPFAMETLASRVRDMMGEPDGEA
ncbi:PAS domain-containing protein [Aquabacter spiritensis]|uniref:histidine kinase n=1 Tax=Aquabacter spiritensis TaxID=933073 RepID=A0A4V2UX87_9HYPH|nr:PAS domain-containing protein [Aquabacter spiritensis]TCT02618.1 PAS domain S-box-containing protein [Aquabacter spiritensis]